MRYQSACMLKICGRIDLGTFGNFITYRATESESC